MTATTEYWKSWVAVLALSAGAVLLCASARGQGAPQAAPHGQRGGAPAARRAARAQQVTPYYGDRTKGPTPVNPGGALLDGFWNPLYTEDGEERGAGPAQGDYAGLPITREAVLHGQAYNPEILDIPPYQCRPHPAIYGLRGAGGFVRIWQTLDPVTQRQQTIRLWLRWQQQYWVIWMNGHPQPPSWTPHTWQGFSRGWWVGDVLHVHTDMLKPSYVRRNGLDTNDRATLDQEFFRNGNYLVDIMMVSDPGVLAQPMVKSTNWAQYLNAGMIPYPCESVQEDVVPQGWVPEHMPNETAVEMEYAVKNDEPIQATYGGAQTMLPSYQDYMKKLPANPSLKSIEQLEQQQADAAAKAAETPMVN